MVRYALILAAAGLCVIVGCAPSYEGAGQMAPPAALSPRVTAQAIDTSAGTEAMLVEQVAAGRQTYRQGLEKLVDFYTRTGNSMKLNWARTELDALNRAPQYRFVIQAEAAGPDLRAMTLIAGADVLYRDGMAYYSEGRPIVGLTNEGKLRMALDRFNQLIADYPTSDKIDDAAYAAGEIYEYFGDYSIAALYYTRAFQWDDNTPHPARFKAAYVYDRHLANRQRALELYQDYLARDPRNMRFRRYAENRVAEIMKEPTREPQPLPPSVPPVP